MTQRLGSERGARARVLQLATVNFRFRWEAWIDAALLARTPVPARPATAAELRGVRAWLGFHELARSEERRGNDHVAGALAGARAFERVGTHRQLERWIGRRIPDAPARRVCFLADGLRFELAQVSPVIDEREARQVLIDELESVHRRFGPATDDAAVAG